MSNGGEAGCPMFGYVVWSQYYRSQCNGVGDGTFVWSACVREECGYSEILFGWSKSQISAKQRIARCARTCPESRVPLASP